MTKGRGACLLLWGPTNFRGGLAMPNRVSPPRCAHMCRNGLLLVHRSCSNISTSALSGLTNPTKSQEFLVRAQSQSPQLANFWNKVSSKGLSSDFQAEFNMYLVSECPQTYWDIQRVSTTGVPQECNHWSSEERFDGVCDGVFPPLTYKICKFSVTFPSPPQEIQSKVVLLYDDDCVFLILFITWAVRNIQIHPNWALRVSFCFLSLPVTTLESSNFSCIGI